MITGHQISFDIRPEFAPSKDAGVWAADLGAIDAPDLICAGAFESARAYSYPGHYPLPIVINRERAK